MAETRGQPRRRVSFGIFGPGSHGEQPPPEERAGGSKDDVWDELVRVAAAEVTKVTPVRGKRSGRRDRKPIKVRIQAVKEKRNFARSPRRLQDLREPRMVLGAGKTFESREEAELAIREYSELTGGLITTTSGDGVRCRMDNSRLVLRCPRGSCPFVANVYLSQKNFWKLAYLRPHNECWREESENVGGIPHNRFTAYSARALSPVLTPKLERDPDVSLESLKRLLSDYIYREPTEAFVRRIKDTALSELEAKKADPEPFVEEEVLSEGLMRDRSTTQSREQTTSEEDSNNSDDESSFRLL